MRHSPRLWILLALLGLLPLGCSATGIGKPFGSRMKTVASNGDRPLPVVTGDPGDAIVADGAESDEIDRRPRLDGKISGRVVDERGDPAPGVVVRVADSGLRGGKVARTRTDRSGGFTLRGLRPGSDYTVIAEAEDEQGLLTGRAGAQAPETGVEIALGTEESDPVIPRSAKLTSRKRVASNASADDSQTSSYANSEDIRPQASDREPSVDRRRTPAPATKNAWSRGGSESASASTPASRSNRPAPVEEDENPLPPALEREPAEELSPRASHPRKSSGEIVHASPDLEVVQEAPAELPAPSAATAPLPLMASTVVDTPPYDPFLLVAAPEPRETAAVGPEPLGEQASDEPKPLATLSRLAARERSDAKMINKVSLSDASAGLPTPTEGLTTKSSVSRLRPVGRSVRYSGSKPADPLVVDKLPLNGDISPACKFDEKQSRVIDFRLVDLQGRPTRLSDIHADFVLLDFWGSWCEPCKESIPHLIELQKRTPPAKLQVLGIACERGPADSRAVTASSAARKLKVNYPILVTDGENGCPLQQALHVQSYPTMVLLDREGRIVWRASGSTEANLARLDRVLAASATVSKSATQVRR